MILKVMNMRRVVLGLNAAMTLGSAAAAVIGVARPTLIPGPGTEATIGLDTYARLYAVRAVPLAAALGWMLFRGHGRGLAPVLAVAGIAQLGDAAIGVDRKITGMAAAGSVGALVHLTSLWWLAHDDHTRGNTTSSARDINAV